jgi:hypothetical protein
MGEYSPFQKEVSGEGFILLLSLFPGLARCLWGEAASEASVSGISGFQRFRYLALMDEDQIKLPHSEGFAAEIFSFHNCIRENTCRRFEAPKNMPPASTVPFSEAPTSIHNCSSVTMNYNYEYTIVRPAESENCKHRKLGHLFTQ